MTVSTDKYSFLKYLLNLSLPHPILLRLSLATLFLPLSLLSVATFAPFFADLPALPLIHSHNTPRVDFSPNL
jgi:hypothetical protein